jgi:hypothetical protein
MYNHQQSYYDMICTMICDVYVSIKINGYILHIHDIHNYSQMCLMMMMAMIFQKEHDQNRPRSYGT